MIEIKIRNPIRKLKFAFLLLLVTTILYASQNSLLINSYNGQFPSIRNSSWFWTESEVISTESSQNSEYPEIAVDSQGNIHVVWMDFTDYLGSGTDRDIFYKRWEIETKSWTNTEIVSVGDFESFTPDIDVDSQDNVHIVWEENSQAILYKNWTASSQSWGSITTISTESTASTNTPRIKVDLSDNLHVVWIDDSDYGGAGGSDIDIFYKIYNSTKLAWSTTQVVSTESNAHSFIPHLAVDSIGNVHVVWYDSTDYLSSGTDYDIFYKYLEATTKIWQPAEVLSNESIVISANPDIAVDNMDNIHIVWEDSTGFDGAEGDSDIFYIIYDKESSSWKIPEVISDVGEAQSWLPAVVTDIENNIHVVWEDSPDYDGADTDIDIFYRMFSSTTETWSRTEVISTDSTVGSRFADIDVGKYGSVSIVWYDYTNLSYSGNDIDIFINRFIGPSTEPVLAPIVPYQIDTNMLQLNWNDLPGIKQYHIYRDTSYIWTVDQLNPIFTVSANTIIDTLPDTEIYYYVIVADNAHFNSSISNCIFVEYSLSHVREFVIPLSLLTIVATIVITLRIQRRRNKI